MQKMQPLKRQLSWSRLITPQAFCILGDSGLPTTYATLSYQPRQLGGHRKKRILHDLLFSRLNIPTDDAAASNITTNYATQLHEHTWCKKTKENNSTPAAGNCHNNNAIPSYQKQASKTMQTYSLEHVVAVALDLS